MQPPISVFIYLIRLKQMSPLFCIHSSSLTQNPPADPQLRTQLYTCTEAGGQAGESPMAPMPMVGPKPHYVELLCVPTVSLFLKIIIPYSLHSSLDIYCPLLLLTHSALHMPQIS